MWWRLKVCSFYLQIATVSCWLSKQSGKLTGLFLKAGDNAKSKAETIVDDVLTVAATQKALAGKGLTTEEADRVTKKYHLNPEDWERGFAGGRHYIGGNAAPRS